MPWPLRLNYSCRLTGELLRLSHPRQTQYFPLSRHWKDGSGKQTLHAAVFRELGDALGRSGLVALKQLLGQRVQLILKDLLSQMRDLETGGSPSPRFCCVGAPQQLKRWPCHERAAPFPRETHRQSSRPSWHAAAVSLQTSIGLRLCCRCNGGPEAGVRGVDRRWQVGSSRQNCCVRGRQQEGARVFGAPGGSAALDWTGPTAPGQPMFRAPGLAPVRPDWPTSHANLECNRVSQLSPKGSALLHFTVRSRGHIEGLHKQVCNRAFVHFAGIMKKRFQRLHSSRNIPI